MNTKTIKFDLNKYKLYEKIKAKQGDTKSRFLLFQLLDGSVPFNLKNRSVRAYMIKPDGKEIFNDLIVNNYNLGYCTLELTNQVLAVPGTVKIELMVTEEEKKLTSSVFEVEVVKSINSEKSIVSTNEFTALLNGLAALSEYDNYKNAVKEMEINKADKAKVEEKFGEVYEQLEHTVNYNLKQVEHLNVINSSSNFNNLTKIVGHRGASGYAPENTLEAIEKAYELGWWGVECDPRLTKDGNFIIMHDTTVDRTTNGTGKVSNLTLSQIKSFDINFGNNLSSYNYTLKVPSLDEWVAKCKELEMKMILHIDDLTEEQLNSMLAIINRYSMLHNCVFITWQNMCEMIKNINKNIDCYIISFSKLTTTKIDTAKKLGCGVSYGVQYFDSAFSTEHTNLIKYANEKNVLLSAWTVNNNNLFNLLKTNNVEYITTDNYIDTRYFELKTTTNLISSIDEYEKVKNTSMAKLNSIPESTVNGYYFNENTNTIHCNSIEGKSGFIFQKYIGKVRKGDIIEIFANVNIISGIFKTLFDTTTQAGIFVDFLKVGDKKLCRKFIVPYDDDNLRIAIGTGTNEVGNYTIQDGIFIKIKSNTAELNLKDTVDKMCVTLVSDTSLDEKFKIYNGDSCTITKANDYGVYVEFANKLARKGCALASMGLNGQQYRPYTAYTTENRAYIGFVDMATQQRAFLSDLPNTMYVDLLLV